MRGTSGALAFEFGDDGERNGGRLEPDATGLSRPAGIRTIRLQPERPVRMLRGPGKYRVLEHRRRQAQIKARRLLDLLDLAESRSNAR